MIRTPTTATVSGTDGRVEIPGDFYVPSPLRLVRRDGPEATADPGPLVRHEGLAYEAAHFATLLAEGRLESPWLPWAETLDVMRTMDEIRRQVGVVYPGEGT